MQAHECHQHIHTHSDFDNDDHSHLIVETIRDSIWLNSATAHCKQDFDSQYWLMIQTTQLHQHTVADLQFVSPTVNSAFGKLDIFTFTHSVSKHKI